MPTSIFSKSSNCSHIAKFLFLLVFGLALMSCGEETDSRFERLDADDTGITFTNQLQNTPEFNILNYLYFYDGGGVSIGDINNDSLPDIYLTANMQKNKLYLNKGDFKFEDITESAGVAGNADWTTGTAMADVNGDGLLDIYVSSVNYLTKSGRNQLFINNGDGTFTDHAAKYGLDFEGYSKQATFFDYDNDGDLDVYLLNHAVHSKQTFTQAEKRSVFSEDAGDKLFRNDEGIFTDVTKEAGIYSSAIGFGLAATASDLNSDGCQDIYVSNDFHENDYLYINNCDGTFREVLEQTVGHTSRASMGNDIADFNNDGRPDIFVLDMLPSDEKRLKSSVSSEPYNVYNVQRDFGYHPQLIRNTLQLNMGLTENGNPLFSEIGQLAGVGATDWSWATLFFDMNNDGSKDIFVSNGIFRRPNDLDYLALVRSDQAQQALERGMSDTTMSLINKMPHVKIPNVAFKNEGDLDFNEVNTLFGFDEPSYSSGAAYGDLDNDGDLDLVVNNVNSPVSVYRNRTREKEGGNYLKIKLQAEGKNSSGIGAKVHLYSKGKHQLYEMMLTRGFQSSVEPLILAGLDSSLTVDSLKVTWPDKSTQKLTKIRSNQTLTLKQADANENESRQNNPANKPVFEDITSRFDTLYHHNENSYVDFQKQQLMPHMLSTQGPGMAVADVNGDGLDDFYIGGAQHQAGSLFLQNDDGTFQKSNEEIFEQDRNFEDVHAVFFDANGDGARDLYVVSGGNRYPVHSQQYQDRLYLNDGAGTFLRMNDALPQMFQNGSVAAPSDFDNDGDVDLFVGSRSIPFNYGYPPSSFLLQNDGTGHFSDVTDHYAPSLRELGMVTDASWNDINGDDLPDLVIAGEWMNITVFTNEDGNLVNGTETAGLAGSSGWWNTLAPVDFDNDGDTDFLAGNLGYNSYLKASKKEPLVLYLKDFNNDGQVDPVIARSADGSEYPVATRDELLFQFKFLRSKFRTYDDFAGSTMQQIFGAALNDSVIVKKVVELGSVFLKNDGTGKFTIKKLPRRAQFAPIFSFLTGDFNGDGKIEALAAGNFYENKPALGGQYDASYGWYLNNSGEGSFEITNPLKSGFLVDGQTRDIKKVMTGKDSSIILVAKNNKPLMIFKYSGED